MEPRKIKKAGRELGNAAAAALICVDPKTGQPIKPETYQWYVRVGKPAGNRAPGHVEIDNVTGQRMYPLKEVRAWQRKRKGRGNWGGIGAKARKPEQAAADAAEPVVEPDPTVESQEVEAAVTAPAAPVEQA